MPIPSIARHTLDDVRLAARALRRGRGYALASVLLLALGVGANTAIFSAVHGILIRPLPYAHGDRMVHVTQPLAVRDVADAGFSATELSMIRDRARTLDGLAEYHSMPFNMISEGEPARVQTGVVSANFFEILGVRPLLGRTFRPGEDEPGSDPVLVLSHAYWINRLGGDPNVVGKKVEMTDRIHTIVGVLPPFPQYPGENDVYMPSSSCPFRAGEAARTQITFRLLNALGRVRPGVSPEQAQTELAQVMSAVRSENPEGYPQESGFGVAVAPLRKLLAGDSTPTLALLGATALFVLLITLANVANLHVVRSMQREHELAMRTALGATRGRLLRSALAENAVLGLVGGIGGLAVAAAGTKVLAVLASRLTPRASEIAIDGTALAFALAVALLTSLAAGLIPLRASSRRIEATLRARGTAPRRARGFRLEGVLVAAQVALSVVLLVSAGLMVRTLLNLNAVDAGYDAERVVSMRLTASRDKYTTPDLIEQLNAELLDAVRQVPGVSSAAFSLVVPLAEGTPNRQTLLLEGQSAESQTAGQDAEVRLVSADYFSTIGAALVRGRTFGPEDRRGGSPVAIMSRSLAERLYPGRDAIGQRFSVNNGRTWVEVVGVAPDIKDRALDAAAPDVVYGNLFQSTPLGINLVARTSADPAGVTRALREAIRAVDPQLPVDRISTLAALRDESIAARRLTTLLLGGFGALALAIAMIGTGAVLAFQVGTRTREIGVRMAIGAKRSEIVAMVLRQGLGLTAIGIVVGVGVSIAAGRIMERFIFGLAPWDPVTLGAVALVLLGAAAGACVGPARRAAAVDPLVALRNS